MGKKKPWFAARLSGSIFLKLTGFLIMLSLLAAFFLVFENSFREEARLKRELTDWGAQLARGMGERPPSCDDDFDRGRIREHFAAMKQVFPDLRALRFIDVDREGAPLLRICSETRGGDAPALSRPLPEELRLPALEAVKERKAGVVMPYGTRRGKGIAVFAPLGHGRYSGREAALLLDVDPSLISRRVWMAARPPLAAVGVLCLLAVGGGIMLKKRPLRPGDRGKRKGKAEAVIAAAACAVITFTFFLSYRRHSAAESNLIFHRLAERRANQIVRLLNNSCTVKMETLGSFFETRDGAGEKEFVAFAKFLADDPLIRRWEWVSAVPGRERESFEAKIRSEGRPGFAVWEKDGNGNRTRLRERENYYVVTFVSPIEGDGGAMGYDMGSEPARNRTITESIATGRTLATDPVSMVQESGEEKGFLILRPVFHSPGGRIKGFALARLALSDLLSYSGAMSGDDGAGVSTAEIYLARGSEALELLECSASGQECGIKGGTRQTGDTFVFPLSVFGKSLIIAVHKGPAFNAAYPGDSGMGILAAGLFLILAVYFLVSALAGRGEALEEMVMERTKTLRESEKKLREAQGELEAANASLEAALAEARELAQRAEAANVAKGQFLANVSHEIRTPLNGVIGLADILEDTPLTDEQREYAALLKSSGRHLLALIDDVLDFSKLEAGKLMIREEEFSLREFMDEIFAFGAARASVKGLEFRGIIPPSAPPFVLGDRFRIRQILSNLLDNAVKFTDAGQITLTVSRDGADERGCCTLRFGVADTGIGVPYAAQGQLFAEFSQVDPSLTRQHGGTGLGLAISKELADLMGGEIGVLSPSGLTGGGPGAEFWFTVRAFEIFCPEEDGEPAPAAAEPGPTARPDRLKILAAEDNAINRRVIAAILSGAGIEADFAEDGAQALAALEKADYDAVLMDVQMPVMDGLEATREIRLRERRRGLPPVPVIALTAHAMPGDREMCVEAGMNEYVSKPIDRRDFLEALYRLVSVRGPQEKRIETGLYKKSPRVFAPEFLLENLGGDREAAADILADFAAEIPAELAAIRERAGAGDAEQAARHAHTLKGAAGGIGGEEVSELAFMAEKAGREGDLEAIIRLLPELERAFADLEGAVALYLE